MDSAASSRVTEPLKDTEADVPAGVQLVQAPYKLRRKNSDIIRDFLVFKGDVADTYQPDVRLRTKNALLQSAVYINDQNWERPVSIHARTKNSDLVLSIVGASVHFVGRMANVNVTPT